MTAPSLEQIAQRCAKVRWQGRDTFNACCVAHDDRNPSMSVTERDGKILAHCHAGCPQVAVIGALGISSPGSSVKCDDSSLFPERISLRNPDTGRTEARAKRAVELSTPAPSNHPYLVKKGIQPHGIGLLGGLYPGLPRPVRNRGNVLVIPMRDIKGEVLSCQFIAEDGSKAYMAGPKRKGGFYYIKGKVRLWVCEGFATGASLAQDTGDSVAVAFDANGLSSVTGALRATYPRREIILMADDDWQTDGNPGLTKARRAASSHGLNVIVPDFSGFMRGPKDTDFNDLVRLRDG